VKAITDTIAERTIYYKHIHLYGSSSLFYLGLTSIYRLLVGLLLLVACIQLLKLIFLWDIGYNYFDIANAPIAQFYVNNVFNNPVHSTFAYFLIGMRQPKNAIRAI